MEKMLLNSFLKSYFDFHTGVACIIALLILAGYLCCSHIMGKRNKMCGKWFEVLRGLVLSVYFTFLICGTLLNRSIGGTYGMKFIPFWSYRQLCIEFNISLIWQIVYNVLVFIPLGFVLPLLWSYMRKFKRVVWIVLSFVVFVEFMQLICRCGWFEFDDIFHNTLGATIGYGIWKLFYTLRRKRTHE